jgi:hypothetical protein
MRNSDRGTETQRMIQGRESHGWEGGLVPALVECHSTSGGKPPFPTRSLCFLNQSFRLCASVA